MQYELIYAQDEQKGTSLIGAQRDKTFVPKKPDENDQGFLARLGILNQNESSNLN